MMQSVKKYLDDLLVLLGSGLIVFATWRWSVTAAIYVCGIILISLGVVVYFKQKGGAT
jgi:hypothetical protein